MSYEFTINGSYTAGDPTIRGPSLADYNFTTEQVPLEAVVGEPSVSEQTIDGAVYNVYDPADVDVTAEVRVNEGDGQFINPTFRSLDTDIAEVSSIGHVTRVSDGTVGIMVESPYCKRREDVTVVRNSGQNVNEFLRFPDNSFGRACEQVVDPRLVGVDPNVGKPYFSTQNHASSIYVPNEDCWAADLDFTCNIWWNNQTGTKFGGCLISPRHFLGARHAKLSVGRTVRFVKTDGTPVDILIEDTENVAASIPDMYVGLLAEEIPSGIRFAEVPPEDFADYIHGVENGIPCVLMNQQNRATIADLKYDLQASFDYPHDATRFSFNQNMVSGDSSRAAYIPYSTAPLLATAIVSGNAGYGYGTWSYIDEINSAMTSLGGGYQLTEADLSAYTNLG